MSGHQSGYVSGNQERSSRRRPTQQYHEDTYHRSSSYDESDDNASQLRSSRPTRFPGMTPHHDPYQHMRPSANQHPRSFTTRAVAGSDVAADLFPSTPAHNPDDDAFTNIYGRQWADPHLLDPSLADRDSAVPTAYASSHTGGHLYPQTLDFDNQSAPTQDRRTPAVHPLANDTNAVAYYNRLLYRPQVSHPPAQRSPTQSSNVGTSPQRQQPARQSPTGGSLLSALDNPNAPSPYGRSSQPPQQYQSGRGNP